MKQTLGLLAALLLLAGCPNDDDGPDAPPTIFFTGVTELDALGQPGLPNGNVDTTDWRFDDVWSEQENALFGGTFDTACALDFPYFLNTYPNPAFVQFPVALRLELPPNARLELKVVDEDFNVVASYDTLTAPNLFIDLSATGIKDTVRFYYRALRGNCAYRGHGDVVLK